MYVNQFVLVLFLAACCMKIIRCCSIPWNGDSKNFRGIYSLIEGSLMFSVLCNERDVHIGFHMISAFFSWREHVLEIIEGLP